MNGSKFAPAAMLGLFLSLASAAPCGEEGTAPGTGGAFDPPDAVTGATSDAITGATPDAITGATSDAVTGATSDAVTGATEAVREVELDDEIGEYDLFPEE